MSASSNQLDEIYTQVRESFYSNPVISVRPIKGDPPDQYKITYSITGMSKDGEGKIVESTEHTVEISIPFGFPHFPPSCKPKSETFHPDFDPAAICLGDFWEQDRLLSDLVIHIGQMINGEIYSTTNAFNEDAADWYLENSNIFPFAQINWITDTNAKSSSKQHIHEIDTLDDADLTTEFDFLSLEEGGDDEDIVLNTSFPDSDPTTPIDIEPFKLLKNQKKYFTLLKKGEDSAQFSDELSGLCQYARGEIQIVEKLHSDGKKFENKGNAQIALEKYQQIITRVTDFPNIDNDIQRIQQTLNLLGNLSSNIDSFKHKDSAEAVNHDPKPTKPNKKPTPAIAKKTNTAKPQSPADPFLSKGRRKNKSFLISALALVVISIGCAGYFWYSFADKLKKAEDAYAQCSTSNANNQFDAAKRSCDKALQLVHEVKFFHQDFVHQLEKFILEILQSEKLTQGLAGNILIENKYIPKDEAKNLLSIKQKLNEAEALYKDDKWQPALKLYETLLSQSKNNAYLSTNVRESINHNRLMCEFRISYDPAQVLIQKKQWEGAIEKLLQAQKILVSLPESDREKYSEKLQNSLQMSQFANLKQQGDLSFTGSDWLSAIETYSLALASGQKTSLPPESIDAIRNNIKRAELYTSINKGNKAFASGSWDEAIKAYNEASVLLSGNKGIHSEQDSDINIQKLSKIILQASIIRDRQAVQTLLENNELANAKRIYQQTLSNISKSTFRTEKEFSDTTSEIRTAIKSLDDKISLTKKIEYLKANYQTLFIANYPMAIPENLTNPVINKTKETESKLVFKMQCTENDGGRPLTLVMYYAYEKKTGHWNLFSENN